MDPEPEELERRTQWFEWYVDQLDHHSVHQPRQEEAAYRCPCCGCKTLPERGGYDICPVCFWEDDGQDDPEADMARGGPNYGLSLTQARANYRSFGACAMRARQHVRKPLPEEL